MREMSTLFPWQSVSNTFSFQLSFSQNTTVLKSVKLLGLSVDNIDKTWLLLKPLNVSKFFLKFTESTHDVTIIFLGNGFGDPRSNSGIGCLHITSYLYSWESNESKHSISIDRVLNLFDVISV